LNKKDIFSKILTNKLSKMIKKPIFKFAVLSMFVLIAFSSCQSETTDVEKEDPVSLDLMSKLAEASFDVSTAKMTTMFGEEGVRVEDMFFTVEQINELIATNPTTRQYHTTNLVKNLPRVITIAVSPDLGALGSNALDDAIDMYNDAGSLISFNVRAGPQE
jgi:hypothetical protein